MRLLCLLAVLGGLVYLGWDKPFRAWMPGSQRVEASSRRDAKAGANADNPDQIVLKQPTPVRLKYGSAVLPAGLSLHVVSKTADGVVVDYAGEHVTLPTH